MKTNRFTLIVLSFVLLVSVVGCGTFQAQPTNTPVPTNTPEPTNTPKPTATPSWQDFEPGSSWYLNTPDDWRSANCLAFTLGPCQSWTYQGSVVMVVYEDTIAFDVDYDGANPDSLMTIEQAAKLFGVPDEVFEAALALERSDWGKPFMLAGWGYQAKAIGAIEIIFVRGGIPW
jgi:hypothetical protein